MTKGERKKFRESLKSDSLNKLLRSRKGFNQWFRKATRERNAFEINLSSDGLGLIWDELQKRCAPCTIPVQAD